MKNLLLVTFLLFSSNAFAQTENELRKMIQQNPKNIAAYEKLILLAPTREQIMKVGNEALTAIGTRSQLHTAMGNAYMNAKDFNNAVNSYRIAVSLNPRSATSFNRLGLALLRIGYYHQAEVAFHSAVAYSRLNTTSNLMYQVHLAIAFENQKDLESAKKVVNQVLSVNPNLALALETQKRLQ